MESVIDREEPCCVERLVDRYWFLVQRRRSGEPEQAGTVVLRDGESLVVSVAARAIGWPEGTLLFRLPSETTPCVGCVDRALAFAHRHTGRPLTPADVREMLRFAVNRCAAWGPDPAHERAHSPGTDGVPPSGARPRADWRSTPDLWLVL
jgi:hypothetical protein